MSIGSFFKSVGSEIEKLFKTVVSATFEQKAIAAVSYAAPLIEEIAQLVGGTPAESIVAAIVAKLQSSVATISLIAKNGAVAAGSSAAATITTAVDDINENMSAILSNINVKNLATATQIEGVANLITGEFNALMAGMTGTTTPTPAQVAPTTPVAAPAATVAPAPKLE